MLCRFRKWFVDKVEKQLVSVFFDRAFVKDGDLKASVANVKAGFRTYLLGSG